MMMAEAHVVQKLASEEENDDEEGEGWDEGRKGKEFGTDRDSNKTTKRRDMTMTATMKAVVYMSQWYWFCFRPTSHHHEHS